MVTLEIEFGFIFKIPGAKTFHDAMIVEVQPEGGEKN